jgi:hypothetical protein
VEEGRKGYIRGGREKEAEVGKKRNKGGGDREREVGRGREGEGDRWVEVRRGGFVGQVERGR